MSESNGPSMRTIRMPPTLIILTVILLAAAVLSQILPAGEFHRERRVINRGGTEQITHLVQEGETLDSILHELGRTLRQGEQPRDATTGASIEQPLRPGQEIALTVYLTDTRTVVIPGSYAPVDRAGDDTLAETVLTVVSQVAMAPIRGFRSKADIIAFILIIGGAFGIVLATGAVDAALRAAVAWFSRGGADWVVIPAVMIIFSAGGAIFGMSEEVIPFVMITIPLALRMGYDAITGICMSWLAAGLGFAGAFFNPFTVQVAQGIAEIPPVSGFGFRVVVWVLATTIGIVYTMWWAMRVKKQPTLSPTHENDKRMIHKFSAPDGVEHHLGTREVLVLVTLGVGIALIVWGVIEKGWYMEELCGVFLMVGVFAAVFGRIDMERAAGAFVRGAADLCGAALIVAFSAGIVIVMEQNQILDTILNWVAGLLGGTHSIVAAWLMFLFQSVLNFFVPSGSGQAAMTMPIMAPLSDLVGITRQTAVLAYQFGDGFGNLIIPTSAVTMSVLGIAEIPWERWARWVLPLLGILTLFAFLMLAIAVMTGYS